MIDDITNLMFDENSAIDHRTLIGHSGPVFAVSFSPDKNFVVSASEDGTGRFFIETTLLINNIIFVYNIKSLKNKVRLWCCLTYTCLVSYKGHNGPAWDVKFR